MQAATLSGAERDVAFDATDFQRVRSLIRAKAGIDLHPGKQNMVYGRLSRRLRETRHDSFRGYLDALERTGGEEWQEFINCLTTNLTSFFRELPEIDWLRQRVVDSCRDAGVDHVVERRHRDDRRAPAATEFEPTNLSGNVEAGKSDEREVHQDDRIRVVLRRGGYLRDDRYPLGHLLAPLHRPRYVLDPGASPHSGRRSDRRIQLGLCGIAQHLQGDAGTARGERGLLGVSRAVRRLGLDLGLPRDVDVRTVRRLVSEAAIPHASDSAR